MKCDPLFVGGQERYAEIHSKALTLKDCNHMFSTESYQLQASVLGFSYRGRYRKCHALSCLKRKTNFLNSIIIDGHRLSLRCSTSAS